MLWVVLGLVAAAFGLLVTALTSGDMLFAWLSVAVSAVAAAVLIVDWAQRRARQRSAPDDAGPIGGPLVPEADSDSDDESDSDPDTGSDLGGDEPDAPTEPDETDEPAVSGVGSTVPPEQEPPEEDTDAADILIVAESRLAVVVVDERPRYHLSGCAWLGRRATLPLPVREARELGFTPCAVCTPDRVLATQTRRTARA